MTNINCLKRCKFQIEGKCSCDSVIMTIENHFSSNDPECPYLIPSEGNKSNYMVLQVLDTEPS